MSERNVYRIYDLLGVVQGVGLRATVSWLASKAGLGGWVQNRSDRVRLRLEGRDAEIAAFMRELPSCLPPSARLDAVNEIESGALAKGDGKRSFRILASEW